VQEKDVVFIFMGQKKKFATLGDLVLVAIKKLRLSKRSRSRVKKGQICKGVIIRLKKNSYKSLDLSSSFTFNENAVVLLDAKYKLIGSRIIGPISRKFKSTKYSRIVSVSAGLI